MAEIKHGDNGKHRARLVPSPAFTLLVQLSSPMGCVDVIRERRASDGQLGTIPRRSPNDPIWFASKARGKLPETSPGDYEDVGVRGVFASIPTNQERV